MLTLYKIKSTFGHNLPLKRHLLKQKLCKIMFKKVIKTKKLHSEQNNDKATKDVCFKTNFELADCRTKTDT